MIELPEATTIAAQMRETLAGKRISSAVRGNAPHKFAFYSRSAEEYATILKGKTMGLAQASGSLILLPAEPGYILVLGGGGERILFHATEATLPAKHQLLLAFDDGAYLTVTVQGWGSCQLFTPDELEAHKWFARRTRSPLDDDFTFEYFKTLFAAFAPEYAGSVKHFVISEPGIWGVANGYLQDILFRAGIHARTRTVSLTAPQRRALYEAIVATTREAVKQGGRDDEYGLHGQPGRYHRMLGGKSASLSRCPKCSGRIVKESYLGGAITFCPRCQPAPARALNAPRAR